jgi:F-type H+-transporting ATPase subunit c
MLYLFGLAIATGFGVAVAAIAGAIGQSRAIAAALEGTARQPEVGGRLMIVMIIGLGFIESLSIYALVVGLLLRGHLPSVQQVIPLLK